VLSRYDPARVPLLRDDDLLLAALQDVVTGEGDVGRREVRRELLVVTLISTAFLVGVLFAIRGARALALAILIALASCLVPRALRRVRGQEGVALQGVRLLIEESGQPDPLRADVLRLLPCPGGTIHLDSSPGFSGLSDGDGAPGSARVEAPLGVVVRGIQSGRAIPSLGIELVPGERLTNGSSVRLDEVWTREEAGWRNIGPLGPGGTALAGHRRASSTGSLARVVRQLEEIGLVHPPAMVARIEARSSGVAPLVAGWSGLGDPWELPMLLIVLGPDP
jgi:hypothetical protein